MSARYAFEIPGPITGKARPRMTRHGRTYTPAKTVSAENWVKVCALDAGVKPLDGPVTLHLTTLRPVPKSWSKARKAAALTDCRDWRKPDADNIAKLIADALNGIAWGDDAQIADLRVEKRFAVNGVEKTVVHIFGASS